MLVVENLTIAYPENRKGDLRRVVDGISFQINPGETLGIVGESGSGKSTTALGIKGLLPSTAQMTGDIRFATDHPRIGMVFQEPLTALNPVQRCGRQVLESIILHSKLTPAEAKSKTLALFERVRLPDPERIFRAYPHELSGGQKQRVLIAMALCNNPSLLIADEPTTALDSITQDSILDLIEDIKSQSNLSVLFISHDWQVIQRISNRIAVMHEGKIVETGPTHELMHNPAHPYTRGLLKSRPSTEQRFYRLPVMADFMSDVPAPAPQELSKEVVEARNQQIYNKPPLVSIKNLTVRYPTRSNFPGMPAQWLTVLNDVSLDIYEGEILGLIGESGSGKTTLGKHIAGLKNSVRTGIVFQDPYASLNPLMTIGAAIAEPLLVHHLAKNRTDAQQQVIEILNSVGLDASFADRLPAQLSGGQRQRAGIARALAVRPQLLVCDEVVSALDMSVQATILNLLLDLRDRYRLTIVFISHDPAVVHQMCDRKLEVVEGRLK